MAKRKTKTADQPLIAYKGFTRDLKCIDFQYALGETFTHNGPVVRCAQGGFHSCEYPLDVFSYYAPGESRFCEVEVSGEIDRDDADTKIASAQITIKAEISVPDMVARAIAWITERAKACKGEHVKGPSSASSATGHSSASSATGYRSASSATGYRSASSATGDSSASSATGPSSASSATGYSSASSATGYRSAALTTGAYSRATVTKPDSSSVAIGLGPMSVAIGAKGCAIVCANYDDNGRLRHIKAALVGADGIKPNTPYRLDDAGNFVEAQ